MRNLRVSVKLLLCFLVMTIFSIGIAVMSIFQIKIIDAQDDFLYNEATVPLGIVADALNDFGQARVILNRAVLNVDPDSAQQLHAQLEIVEKELSDYASHVFAENKAGYKAEITDAFATLKARWDSLLTRLANGETMESPGLVGELNESGAIASSINAALTKYMDARIDKGAESSRMIAGAVTQAILVCIAGAVLALAVGIFMALYNTRLISNPLKRVVEDIHYITETGDMNREVYVYDARDEIGSTSKALDELMQMNRRFAQVVKRIGEGDLSVSVDTLGPDDMQGNALKSLLKNLNEIFGEIDGVSDLVASGSRQISDGGQSLAQGTTEQAAAIEQLSSTIGEITAQTNETAKSINQCAQLSQTISQNAESGAQLMEKLVNAVEGISASANDIAKVISVIEDISFQTNILALNASVEAARAGSYGKGFAVVAEEVKSLAVSSQNAAKETNVMIVSSVNNAQEGVRIAMETAEALKQIVAGIENASALMGTIAKGANEQAGAIVQVDKGIEQVSMVVQSNSATAQESASASRELSSQADVLRELVSHFKLGAQPRPGSQRQAPEYDAAALRPAVGAEMSRPSLQNYAPEPVVESGGFGKY